MPPKKKTAVAKKAATASNSAAAGSPMSDRRKRGGAKSAAAAVAPSPPPPEKESRKRGRPQGSEPAAKAKKAKLSPAVGGVGAKSLVPHLGEKGGVVLALGQGDTGQLGLGEDIMERSKPAFVKELASEEIMDICAGGMHSMALSKNGEVFTFGCNDEGALGRTTEDDDECYTPGKVDLGGKKIVQISAGDSHSVALDENGKAFFWGNFRDSSGPFGLTVKGAEKLPVHLAPELDLVKIASGADHIALLTSDGALYTLGCAEQGQLGRVGDRFTARGGRRGISLLLTPDRVHAKNRRMAFKDVFAGAYGTYAVSVDNEVLVCGLNNYNQLGVTGGPNTFHTLVKSPSLTEVAQRPEANGGWAQIVPGQHHALALDKAGVAYALGRVEYGRLGLGDDHKEDAKSPVIIPVLKGKSIAHVGAGTAVSFAVEKSTGKAFSWGMGTNGQLGHEDDEDSWTPEEFIGKQLETRKVLMACGGGQHTLLLARDK